MPDICLSVVPRFRESESVPGTGRFVRFDLEKSPKDAWLEFFAENCAPGAVQPNLGRVQMMGAEAYAERFAISPKANCLRYYFASPDDAFFYDFATELRTSGTARTLRDSLTSAEIDVIVRGLESELSAELTSKVSVALRKVMTKLVGGLVITKAEPESATNEPTKGSFLESARRLESLGHIDKALDMVYGHFDSLLRAGDYQRVDSLLASVDPKAFGTDLLLGFLTITLPAKERLASRGRLFGSIEQELRARGDWEDNLLAGLET